MAYTKQTWSNGNVITSAKMNNIEQGIYDAHQGLGGLILQFPTDATTVSGGLSYFEETNGITWQNVYDAVMAGRQVILINELDYGNDHIDERISIVTCLKANVDVHDRADEAYAYGVGLYDIYNDYRYLVYANGVNGVVTDIVSNA